MSEPNLVETQPTSVKNAKSRSGFWIGLLIIVAVIALGAFAGFRSGISARQSLASTQVSNELGGQFELAAQDFATKRYVNAKERLEYIINFDPNYPGAVELLTKVLLEMAITPSPTITPTPTMTPTPDVRAQEAIFSQAQQQYNAADWDNLQLTLDTLRRKYPDYYTAQVDSMYYAVLRNRGVQKILGMGAYAQTTSLEGGIYDLTLAERFGPLDGYADGLRTFARLYIQGTSYWDLDWPQAKDYFGQVYRYAPNLRDSSNFTAAERYRIALLKYADVLYAGTKKDRCQALNYYFESFSIGQDASYTKKVNDLNLECNPPTATPVPATATSEVVVPPVEVPSATPTP
jgi:hypothetical protein